MVRHRVDKQPHGKEEALQKGGSQCVEESMLRREKKGKGQFRKAGRHKTLHGCGPKVNPPWTGILERKSTISHDRKQYSTYLFHMLEGESPFLEMILGQAMSSAICVVGRPLVCFQAPRQFRPAIITQKLY